MLEQRKNGITNNEENIERNHRSAAQRRAGRITEQQALWDFGYGLRE